MCFVNTPYYDLFIDNSLLFGITVVTFLGCAVNNALSRIICMLFSVLFFLFRGTHSPPAAIFLTALYYTSLFFPPLLSGFLWAISLPSRLSALPFYFYLLPSYPFYGTLTFHRACSPRFLLLYSFCTVFFFYKASVSPLWAHSSTGQ